MLVWIVSSDSSNNTNKLSPQEPKSFYLFKRAVQIIQINLVLKNRTRGLCICLRVQIIQINLVLKNTNHHMLCIIKSSNNTNKLSPQELSVEQMKVSLGSNNTNKLSPQEPELGLVQAKSVQIIQINLVLKNSMSHLSIESKFK